MKITATAIVAVLVLAGCSRQPTLDVSGKWYFFRGGRLTLVQDGRRISGTGHFPINPRPTEASPTRMPITAHGKVQGERVLLTLEFGTNTLEDVEFLLAISPTGNQRFLKCPQYLSLTLIPEGVDYFQHEILKPELTELEREREGSQQSDRAATSKPAAFQATASEATHP
jgi:hypothetical protein